MKTIEEFIREIESSEALQNEIKAITNDDEFAEFLKKHDCGASVKEYTDYVKSMSEGEISDDDAKAAAGGFIIQFIPKPGPAPESHTIA